MCRQASSLFRKSDLLVIPEHHFEVRVLGEGIHVIQEEDIGKIAAHEGVDIIIIITRIQDSDGGVLRDQEGNERVGVGILDDQKGTV